MEISHNFAVIYFLELSIVTFDFIFILKSKLKHNANDKTWINNEFMSEVFENKRKKK